MCFYYVYIEGSDNDQAYEYLTAAQALDIRNQAAAQGLRFVSGRHK